MEKNHLNQKKHWLQDLFGSSAYLNFKNEDGQSPDAAIDLDEFKKNIYEEFSHLSFSELKDENAQNVDSLRLYTELSWPS